MDGDFQLLQCVRLVHHPNDEHRMRLRLVRVAALCPSQIEQIEASDDCRRHRHRDGEDNVVVLVDTIAAHDSGAHLHVRVPVC